MEERVAKLEAELIEAKRVAASAMEHADAQKKHLRDATMAWKCRLHSNNVIVKRYCAERDRQLSEITAQMLLFEGRLRGEQKEIVEMVREKDDTIEEQERLISDLTLKNAELQQALSSAKVKGGKNGYVGRNGESSRNSEFLEVVTPESRTKHGTMLTVEAAQYPNGESKRYASKNISKLAAMKNRLRKHKSNSDLNQGDATIVEETPEDVSLSQENLSSTSKIDKMLFRERCKSIAGYPLAELESLINGVTLSDSRPNKPYPDYTHSNSLTVNGDMSYLNTISNDTRSPSHHNTVTDSPTNLHQEYTWKTGKRSVKSKPKNFSSYLSVSSTDISEAPSREHLAVRKSLSAVSSPINQPSVTTSESNPFKSIKSMIKRKGSKLKNKKRSTSLPQSTQAEYQEALKQNNEKYKLQVK